MSKQDKQLNDFMKYISYVEIDGVEYVKTEEEQKEVPGRKTFDDLYTKALFVTWGDDKPWLQVMITPNYSFALEPELALFWLDKITEFYQKKTKNEVVSE